MLNIKPDVKAALMGVCENVFFYFPQTFKKLPCVSFYEAGNAPGAFADDSEYVSEIEIAVDVWAKDSEGASQLAARADKAMAAAGFARRFSADVHNPDGSARHKTMRFSIIKGC